MNTRILKKKTLQIFSLLSKYAENDVFSSVKKPLYTRLIST